jgi:hypothetical protein
MMTENSLNFGHEYTKQFKRTAIQKFAITGMNWRLSQKARRKNQWITNTHAMRVWDTICCLAVSATHGQE